MDSSPLNTDSPTETLVRFFQRNGCLRRPNLDRRKEESANYKKGYEVRLVAFSKRELADIRRAIRKAGLKPGKPFKKVERWVQPIYGKESMEQFVGWVEEFGDTNADDS